MTEEKITELQNGFNTAFINGAFNSNLAYRPQFIYNGNKNKVFSPIEDQLLRCDSFSIGVAFITRGGITPLLQTLQELERRGVPGRILTTDYLSFSDSVELDTIASLSNIGFRMYQTERAGDGFYTKIYRVFGSRIKTGLVSRIKKTVQTLSKQENRRESSYSLLQKMHIISDILMRFISCSRQGFVSVKFVV